MNAESRERIIRSTVHISMLEPSDKLPVSIGSGCLVDYFGKKILLTAAHVTNKEAGTCIDMGEPPVNGQTRLYSVGTMNYLLQFNLNQIDEQVTLIDWEPSRIEAKAFGEIDFGYVEIKEDLQLLQHAIAELEIRAGKKEIIHTNLADVPTASHEYGFFGRTKPSLYRTATTHLFELQEVFYGGLRYVEKINHFYCFELPAEIKNYKDFKGTSGAPIMDQSGRVVALITHGYLNDNKIYGVAVSDFRQLLDVL